MKWTLHLFAILLFLSASCKEHKDDIALVRTSFEKYKSAILSDNGEEAANCVDSKSINYYTNILQKVRTADSLTTDALPLIDKLVVLIIRHSATPEQIKSFDGRQLLIYAIDNGMVGKNGVSNATIGDVIIDHDFAKAQIIANGEKTSVYFHFNKEHNEWKFNITSLFDMSNELLQKMVDESRHSENDLILQILKKMKGATPISAVWAPAKN